MSDNVIHLTAESFSKTVLCADKPVLVDFWASWCGPCRAIAPIVEAIAEKYREKAVICKLDVDAEGALAAEYGVMSIPTLVLFKNGAEQSRSVGLRPQEAIEADLNALL